MLGHEICPTSDGQWEKCSECVEPFVLSFLSLRTPLLVCVNHLVGGFTGEEVVLEYHHPEPHPPKGTFVAGIASVLQVSASQMDIHILA